MDKTLLPLGFPIGGYPAPQGMYYCSVGGKIHMEDNWLKKSTLIYALLLGSILKVIKKWLVASGNFSCLLKVLKKTT
jgi:hypothetical protein